MAEKGILVADAATGESIACRDAVDVDEAGNSRVVQLVDKARRKHGIIAGDYTVAVPDRDYNPASPDPSIYTQDQLGDVSTISAAMANSAITVGDATHVVATCLLQASAATSFATVTPFIIDPNVADPTVEDSVIALLEPKTFTGVSLTGVSGDAFFKTYSGENHTICQPHIWPVLGAEKIAFHVFGSGAKVRLFFRAITADHLTVADTPQPPGINDSAAWTAYVPAV